MSIDKAREKKLLTQKDLQTRWGISVRSIQRTRKEYGLEPADFYGVNPLFTEAEVKRVEQERLEKGLKRAKRRSTAILTLNQIRAEARKQHQKGISK